MKIVGRNEVVPHLVRVELRPDEAKLFLALALEARVTSAWTSTFVDNTVAGLGLALFGDNAVHLDVSDAERLKHEAHAEWRRG